MLKEMGAGSIEDLGPNLAQKQDIVLLSNKIEFSDFLRAI
jgi:hypothetical protein